MFNPLPLNLPEYPFRIKHGDDSMSIFDEVRRKFLRLTPEEWVRQHFVQYLIHNKKYPKASIRLEGGLRLNSLQKRSDILVFNSMGEKILLVECKAPSVPIRQNAFDQISRYNLVHKVPLLAVSNGLQHYYCEIDFEKQDYRFINDLPVYER